MFVTELQGSARKLMNTLRATLPAMGRIDFPWYFEQRWPRRSPIARAGICLPLARCCVRVYEAAAKARPHAPRSFLLVTARHLLTDRLRRKRVVAIDAVGDPDSLNVLVEVLSPEHRASVHQEPRRLAVP